MADGTPDDEKAKGTVPFDRLESHYRNHVVIPSMVFAAIFLILYAATLEWFLDRNGYEGQQALVFLYGIVFLLGYVSIWSIVHTMLAARGEAQSRLMNEIGTPDPPPSSKLIESINDLTVNDIKALNNEQVQNLDILANLSTGARSSSVARSIVPGAPGTTVVLKGLYDAAKNLPDARFLLIAFVFLLLVALSIDSNYELPNLTIDISSQETPDLSSSTAPPASPSATLAPTAPGTSTELLTLETETPGATPNA